MMALLPVFPIKLVLLIVLVAIAAGVLGFASVKGGGLLRKQGAAWVITGLMIVCAIGIGYARAPVNNPAPEPYLPGAPSGAASFVWDEAGVLSGKTIRTLDNRNDRLWERYSVSIGVVTCNYGRDDLGDYAMKCAGEMGLGGYDMIVALDIQGDNYWLIQGDMLTRDFTDQDCSDYAYDYMEKNFAKGNYDQAVLDLTEMLELWYDAYYG